MISVSGTATGGQRLWGQMVRLEYKCAYRTDHAGVKDLNGNPVDIPGTARWKWDEDDEKLWVRCPQGCCTVN